MSETTESGMIGRDPRRYAEVQRDPSASDIRKRTWPHGMPALRLSRTPRRPRHTHEKVHEGGAGLHAHRGWLRLMRLVIGLALLVLAWGGVLIDIALAHGVLHASQRVRALQRFVVAVLQVAAAGWIGLMVLACIVAGAFFLTLALTDRT